jgi:malonyl-CoA O-methyltransferase
VNSFDDLLRPPRLDKKAVRKSFNRSARNYDDSAVLQREVLSRLIERLHYIKLEPKLILDLGCGTGQGIKKLKKQYRKARIVALDLADEMLRCASSQFGLLDSRCLVNADMELLPLKDDCIDLVFSNLTLQWSNDLMRVFREFQRVGREGGLLMFTTFGVNTLKELRDSFSRIDPTPRVHQFEDMHDVGDMLLASGLSQPVMDMETITLEYELFSDLMSDLKSIGATNAENTRSRGLMTASRLKRLEQVYREEGFRNGRFQATYEVVYGHAWF